MDIRCTEKTESGLLWLLVNEWDFQNCCLQYHLFVLAVVQTSPRKGFRERWSHFLEPWRAYSRPFLERWCDRFFYIKTRNIPQKRQFGSWIRGQDENRRWAPPEVHRLEWETRACQKRETTAKEKRGLVVKSYHLRNLNCILYNVISCVWMPALIADLFLPVDWSVWSTPYHVQGRPYWHSQMQRLQAVESLHSHELKKKGKFEETQYFQVPSTLMLSKSRFVINSTM